ncbi:acyl-CoA thioesterase [bacterium]|nr:acyl-CoA thioesterase [bacterium]
MTPEQGDATGQVVPADTQESSSKVVLRAEELAFVRRQPYKTFEYLIEVYLKDTNAYGNVYFSRHFEWQGILREAWFSKCIFKNMLELPGVFITKRAGIEYVAEVNPFSQIIGFLNTKNFKNASFDLTFEFRSAIDNRIMSFGTQTIVFADLAKKPCRIPSEIMQMMKAYERPI